LAKSTFGTAALAEPGYQALIRVCQISPVFLARPLLWVMSLLYWMFAFQTRSRVRHQLTLLGHPRLHSRAVFHHFACFLYEFFSRRKAKIRNENDLLHQIREILVAPGKKGALLLLPHLGNWEIALRWLLDQGYEVSAIAQKHSSPVVDRIFHELRDHPSLEVHPIESGARSCLRALKRQRVVALVCERDYTNQGLKVDFDDFSTHFPLGPSWLMGTGSWETVLVECRRLSLLEFEIQTIPFLASGNLEDRTRQLALAIYGIIRKSPEQWITFDPILEARAS